MGDHSGARLRQVPRQLKPEVRVEDNKKSMLEFIWAAHWGVKGVVRDANTGEGIAGARVHVRNITRVERHVRMEADINHDVTSARAGDYWRLLTEGEYEVRSLYKLRVMTHRLNWFRS